MTAKPAMLDEEIFGYEIVDGRMSAMNHERYLAFIQEGIDSLDRGDTVSHEEAMARLDAILARNAAE